MNKTKAQIIIPKAGDFPYPERVIQIRGTKEQIESAKQEISMLTGSLFPKPPGYMPDPQQMMPMCMMPPPFCTISHRNN